MVFNMGNWKQFLLDKKEQFPKVPLDNIDRNQIYYTLRNRILNIVLNRFVWEKLPDDIPGWFVEDTFLYQGIACTWKDDVVNKHLISPVVLQGKMDPYGVLQDRHIMCPNGVTANRTKDNSVIGWDTYNNFASYHTINTYAEILTRIMVIYLKNIDMQKKSIAILGSQDTILSTKNLIKEISEGVEYIPLRDTYDLKSIQPLNLNVGYCAGDLRVQFKEIWIECLNQFGVEGYTSNKREREVTGEAQGNIGFVEISRASFYNARKDFLEKTKEMFPAFADTEVHFNSNLNTDLNIAFMADFGDNISDSQFNVSRETLNGGGINE